jgi:5-formyltetrahydrofolate cyclo-ligase
MTHTKTEWRRILLQARQALRAPLRRAHSAAIIERVASLPEFAASRAVAVYLPVGAEVDPLALAALAASAGKVVYRPEGPSAAPAWVRNALPAAASPVSALPAARLPTISEAPLLVVVPGVGFDICGTRLGRGQGFYDRALAQLRQCAPVFAVGVAFEVQVVARLPQDPWDQPVDLVATERRVVVPERKGDPHRAQRQAQEVHDS